MWNWNKKSRLAAIEEEIEKLKNGDVSGLRIVYHAFATDDRLLMRRAGHAIRTCLEPYSMSRMIKLYEQFRELTSLEWFVDWQKVSIAGILEKLEPEDGNYVLILGTFHPNGYFREACVRELVKRKGNLPWLLLRINDWVRPVRDTAFWLLPLYMNNCNAEEIIGSLPVMERLWNSRRRSHEQMEAVEKLFHARMKELLTEMDLSSILIKDFSARKSFYRMALRTGLMTLEQLDGCLKKEKDVCGQMILIRGILCHPDCTLERAEGYLQHKSVRIRRIAVEYKYEHLKNCWEGLEEMLLDSGRGVREYAAYILERHSNLDIREYYLSHLSGDHPEYAILGLSEYSRQGNVPVFLKCLEHPGHKALKCTLLALGRQEDFHEEELLWSYLLDDRIDIAKAAYTAILKRDFYPGAERIYQECTKEYPEQQKKYLIRLLCRESSWMRLPWLICLYRNDLPEWEKMLILQGIGGRYMQCRIADAQKNRIYEALDEKRDELPDGIEQGILFDLKFL